MDTQSQQTGISVVCGQQYGSDKKRPYSSSHSQDTACILWNPYRVHNSPSLISILRQIQSKDDHPISLRSVLILSYLLRLGLSSGVLPTGFPSKILHTFLFTPSHPP